MATPLPVDLEIVLQASFIASKKFIEYVSPSELQQLIDSDFIKNKWDISNYSQKLASQLYLNEKEQLKSYQALYNKKLGGFVVNYIKAKHKWGRVFPSKSLGLTSLSKKTRNTLIRNTYYDFDLSNAQPEIVRNLCRMQGIPISCEVIDRYCKERDAIIEMIMQASNGNATRDDVKALMIRLSFFGGFKGWLEENNIPEFPEPLIVKEYRQQINIIAKLFIAKNPEMFKTIKRIKQDKGEDNVTGAFFSTFLQEYELRIVERVLSFLVTMTDICHMPDLPPQTYNAVYEFDGIKLWKANVDNFNIVDENKIVWNGVDGVLGLMNHILKTDGWDMKFELKPITKFYDIEFAPPPHAPKSAKELKEEFKLQQLEFNERLKEEETQKLIEKKGKMYSAYLAMKKTFELTHCKIINKASFMQNDDKKYFMRTKKQMIEAYEHLVYYSFTNEVGDVVNIHFIQEWIKDPSIKKYTDVGVFPNNEKCPKDFLNMWIPFEMERNRFEGPVVEDALDFILNHLKILCDRNEVIYDYFILWIAQMIQHPEFKSTCPILIGKQGGGKGTFMELMKKLLGDEKVLITAQPDKYVWGNFNTLMASAFLVGLDEMTKSMTTVAVEFIKSLITESKIYINDKGHSAYELKSFHHFMMMTNKEDGGITTEKDDRRKLMIRISDEMVGNLDYFDKFYAYLDDPVTMRIVYDYFKSMADVPTKLPPPPGTEYQDNLKSLTESPYTRWLKEFVMHSFDEKDILCVEGSSYYMNAENEYCCQLLGVDLYNKFCKWRDLNGERFETTPLKMGVNLTNMRIPGVLKGKHTKKGDFKLFNFTILKKHFQLGCLVDL